VEYKQVTLMLLLVIEELPVSQLIYKNWALL